LVNLRLSGSVEALNDTIPFLERNFEKPILAPIARVL
jgi:hypothetical protein